ncbi:MAG: peptidoglycan-associated lipoprotein Pal [Pseudomonadota bacterium]|nr:peptidoglycan-associated lipoprotein Pal [Pseudomonadota bacterium]
MLKKLLVLICGATLLAACASKEEGADLYGNATGGWNADVDISELDATGLTKKFNNEVTPVVYFSLNSSDLDTTGKSTLAEQAEWLRKNPRALIVIEGNCDERGTTEYNFALGERRANAARRYLIANGVDSNRIRTISYGKEKPVATGSNEEAWAKNRNATTVAY